MASPIHSVLFSPPPSPPVKARDTVDINTRHGLVSLKTILLPNDLTTHRNLEAYPNFTGAAELKIRSPRTPQQNSFASQQGFPSPYKSSRHDIEATPRASGSTTTPRQTRRMSKTLSSPTYLPSNIPSKPLPIPSSLPRPLLRLVFFATLIISSVLMLLLVPGSRLPSLKAASMSRRLAWASDDSQYLDFGRSLQGWSDALDRDYKPPQVRVPHMMRRAFSPANHVAAPRKAFRPEQTARPLPESHELLAIQSYLLDSSYNVLSHEIDPSLPVDANRVSNHKLGKLGSAEEKAWFAELEQEQQDVVIWYGGDGNGQLPHGVLDILHALHGAARHPTLIPCHTRSDLPLLQGIFNRLAFPLQHVPIVMIGSTPIIGDIETMEELRGNGKLAEMLENIGWLSKVDSSSSYKGAQHVKRDDEEVVEEAPASGDDSSAETNVTDGDSSADAPLAPPVPIDQAVIDIVEEDVWKRSQND